MPNPTRDFTATLREELALNALNDDEGHLRCTCDDCVRDAGEELRALYKDLSDAALYLPIPEGVAPISVLRFQMALHRLHVYCTAPKGVSDAP